MTDAADAADRPVPLLHPREGVPPVVADAAALAQAVVRLAQGTGPVAVDAERASGYRYGQRAYLVQLRRAGSGTVLVDPIGCPDLTALGETIAGEEWVLHAASQDLPCLAELGLRPPRLFDTELAGRLLGLPRVGLGAMVESVLGLTLEKGHSAADWSTRPLPEAWLRYAALDVEVLVELRDVLAERLAAAGKLGWAQEEFAALAAAPPATPRRDPWRRTSGVHRLRRPRQLAVVRALWEERDAEARRRDLAPGRVLPDAALLEAALTLPQHRTQLAELDTFRTRAGRRHLDGWYAAVERAMTLAEDQLPQLSPPAEGPPPARSWADRDPAAAQRLAACRTAIAALADEHEMPAENLLAPDTVRRLAWRPPDPPSQEAVAAMLRAHGAREWQVRLTTAPLSGALERTRRRQALEAG